MLKINEIKFNFAPMAELIELESLISLHCSVQTMLPRVERFSKYRESHYAGELDYPGVRQQNSLQHIVSVELVAHWMLVKLKSWLPQDTDTELVLRAVHLHEIGEMRKVDEDRRRHSLESMGDTHYIDKNDDDDLREYLLFEESLEGFDSDIKNAFREAFLLQFAPKNPENFPEEARLIMERLWEQNTIECSLFQAIERFDYLMYALEQRIQKGNEVILIQVLRNQYDYFQGLCVALPGFSDEIWTDDREDWASKLLTEFRGKWEERKSS